MRLFIKLITCGTLFLALPSQAEHQLEIEKYPVKANSVEQFLKDLIKRKRPDNFDKTVWAMLRSDINVTYSMSSDNDGCKVVVEDAEVIALMQLPEWENVENLSQQKRTWWQLFNQFVTQHELAHYENLTSVSDKLLKDFKENPPKAETCRQAKVAYLIAKGKYFDEIDFNNNVIDKRSSQLLLKKSKLTEPLQSLISPVKIQSGSRTSTLGF